MVDTVRSLLTSIEASGGEGPVDVSAVVAAITAAMEDAPAAAGRRGPAAASPRPPRRPRRLRREEGRRERRPPAKKAAAAKTAQRSRPPRRPPPARPTAPRATADRRRAPSRPRSRPTTCRRSSPRTRPRQPRRRARAVVDDASRPTPPAPDGEPHRSADGQPRRAVADSTIRVDVDLLDELMLLVGELVLTRNQIVQNVARQTDTDLIRASQRLNLIASELQEGVMKTRMQPIDHIWSKLPRVVRDLGLQLRKPVRLEMEGRETELDKTLLEAVKDPLTHLVRNSVDHGIEAPDARKAAGKPAEGVLTLRARHESGQVVVEVADDGAGIDPAKLGAKAVERGLVTADAARPDEPGATSCS